MGPILHLSAQLAYAWSDGEAPGSIVLTGRSDRLTGLSDAYENLVAVHWAASGPDPTGHRDASVVVMHDTGSDGRCVVLPGCSSQEGAQHQARCVRGREPRSNRPHLAWIGPSCDRGLGAKWRTKGGRVEPDLLRRGHQHSGSPARTFPPMIRRP